MFKSIFTALFGVAIVLVLANLAGAVVINAQFYDTTHNTGSPPYVGQGAYTADTGTYWSWIPVNTEAAGPIAATALYTSTDVSTSVTFASTAVHGGWWGEATPTALLGNGMFTQSNQPGTVPDPGTFTIAGLTPGSNWSMYIYAVGDAANSQGTIFSFPGFTANTYTSLGNATAGFVLGGNYVITDTLTANASGQIIGQFQDNGHTWCACNGFQLISSVPEPGTLMLLGCALAGLLCYAWRKRR